VRPCSKSGYRLGCARRGFVRIADDADFSVKGKDEASLARLSCARFVECLRSRFAGNEGFVFSALTPALVSQCQPVCEYFADAVERSVMTCLLKSALVLAASAALGSVCCGAVGPISVFEDFHGDPATNGWRTFGHADLFAWNATNQNLEVTWDSSKPNSYFYKPLGSTLSRDDESFSIYFDLRLRDIAIGTTTNKPYTFQIAVGLLNFQQATNAAFLRGTGFDSPNLFEFDYFPDSGFGATISPTIISSNHQFATVFILQEITTNDLFKVELRLGDGGGRVTANISRNGEFYDGRVFYFPTNFGDFNVDTVAIASYSDEGQFPDYAGSILAHGTVDNVMVSTRQGVLVDVNFVGRFENGNWRMDFDTFPGWVYAALRTEDFFGTFPVPGSYVSTNYGRGTIIYTNPPMTTRQFYRVVGQRQ
jgi:hypothetical protein